MSRNDKMGAIGIVLFLIICLVGCQQEQEKEKTGLDNIPIVFEDAGSNECEQYWLKHKRHHFELQMDHDEIRFYHDIDQMDHMGYDSTLLKLQMDLDSHELQLKHDLDYD